MSHTTANAQRFLLLMDRLRHQRAGPALERLSGMGLSHSHMRLLRMLASEDALPMKQIADRLQLAPPSLTALARRLVSTGLVERRQHADDSRVALLSLTAAGRDLHRQIYHEQLASMERLLAGLTDEEQQLFLDLLARAVIFAGGESPDADCLQSHYRSDT